MALTMKMLNCTSFQAFILFNEKDFYKTRFKKEFNCKDTSHHTFTSHHISENSDGEHAHIEVAFNKKDSQLLLVFHSGDVEDISGNAISEISLENCVEWMAGFFKKQDYFVTYSAVYNYGDDFEPAIKLNYPLLAQSELLRDAKVCGHEIEFLNDSMKGRFLFRLLSNGTISALINAWTDISLDSFHYDSAIEELSQYWKPLLKEKEDAN
jgi:hypothetical protein